MASPIRILLTGDIHIGRSSSHVSESTSRDDVRAATAWSRIVDLAVAEEVSAVCLSGDVADQDNKFWEALGPLEAGIASLVENDIRLIAVSGNHDHDVLERLADQYSDEEFLLLGRGGRWERTSITCDGESVLHVDGWSFPHREVRESPLDSYDLKDDPGIPRLGLVHGDLGAVNTRYAPLELARLHELGPEGWLIGHIHVPRLIAESGSPWVLYPGSPQALDPGEMGVHGPWIVEIASGSIGIPEQRALSSVYYNDCEIDISETEEGSELEDTLVEAIRKEATRITDEAGDCLVEIVLRLRVGGSTPVSGIASKVAEDVIQDLALPAGNATVRVDKITVDTVPRIDLIEYAETQTAPGTVAKLLLELDKPEVSEEVAELIANARRQLAQAYRHRDFSAMESIEVTDDIARDHLRSGARALMTELVGQTL